MEKKPLKYVLLSDVVGSRRITDRKRFEKKLTDTLQKVQQQYSTVFEIPIQVWKGLDETAAIVKEPWRLYEVMKGIDDELAPYTMRFVAALGGIDVLPRDGNVTKADGEAFHKAAQLMGELKLSGMKFACHTLHPATDYAWQVQVNALYLLKKSWTERQRTVYQLYEKAGVQEAVARQLKIAQQTVSKTLKTISAAEVLQLEKMLALWAESQLKK